MGPKWGPSGADRTQVGPMLAPWTLLSKCIMGWWHFTSLPIQLDFSSAVAGIMWCMRQANARWHYNVTPSLIGWLHTENDPYSDRMLSMYSVELTGIKSRHTPYMVPPWPAILGVAPTSHRGWGRSDLCMWRMAFTMDFNSLTCWIIFKTIKNILTSSITSWIWLYLSRWNLLSDYNTCCVSHVANIMPADALATLGARASAGMVLTLKARILHLQHRKS